MARSLLITRVGELVTNTLPGSDPANPGSEATSPDKSAVAADARYRAG
ncbi:MAG TPA: hypothetical protein VF060_32980 [Trebonia sp.]